MPPMKDRKKKLKNLLSKNSAVHSLPVMFRPLSKMSANESVISIKDLVSKDPMMSQKWHESKSMDEEFMRKSLRNEFCMPKDENGADFVYVCGNSLGPQPRPFRDLILEEVDIWAKCAVNGHLDNPSLKNWVEWDSQFLEDFRRLVGANDCLEIAVNSSLTTNLHNLMIHFYRPTSKRFKIITEAMSFPTDYYVLESQVKLHGFDPKTAIIEAHPRDCRSRIIEEEDIVRLIREHGDQVALVMIAGVQYLTGQVFDMKAICKVGHEVGALVAFDLAHAVGNVPLCLSDWDVDFAVWCTYKYLNSGPGGVAGYFVNQKHFKTIPEGNLLAGWWGVEVNKRFLMKHEFEPQVGARAFQQSSISIMNSCGLAASLEIFRKMDIEEIRQRSWKLTQYFRACFEQEKLQEEQGISVITPLEQSRSGAQISLAFRNQGAAMVGFEKFSQFGIVTDRREPDIIRLTFTGLYNSFEDVFLTIAALKHL